MAKEELDIRSQRPTLNRDVKYTSFPQPYIHQYYEDKLAILVCQIKIWECEENDWFKIPSAGDKCLVIRECESIEIADSAKELINKTVVRFPRGTVIALTSKKSNDVNTGTKADNTESTTTLKNATNDGDVITSQASQFSDNGVSTTSMAVNYDNKGLIEFNRTETEVALLSPNDVAVGNRIEIRLGYAYSEQEFNKMNSMDHKNADNGMNLAFTGFITSISATTPLELECTNMAHVLACISTPNIPAQGALHIKDFLDDNGKYKLLEDTGLPLADSSKGSEIFVTGSSISENLTVADVLSAWSKGGVLCMIETKEDGSACLKVGRTYYAGKGGTDLPNNDKQYITYNGGNNTVKIIQFNWDVAEDKLTLKNNDKKYLAIEAQGRTSSNQFFKFTLRKNPDLDDKGWMIDDEEGNFQVVNEKELYNVKKEKVIGGVKTKKRIKSKLLNHVSMDKYNIVPYFSPKLDITKEELIEEAKQYWAKYVPNGISGSISIFGDLIVKPTEVIGLIDERFPEKNGYYYVEEVNTTFGINGYRRELKIPFKIAQFSKTVEVI